MKNIEIESEISMALLFSAQQDDEFVRGYQIEAHFGHNDTFSIYYDGEEVFCGKEDEAERFLIDKLCN